MCHQNSATDLSDNQPSEISTNEFTSYRISNRTACFPRPVLLSLQFLNRFHLNKSHAPGLYRQTDRQTDRHNSADSARDVSEWLSGSHVFYDKWRYLFVCSVCGTCSYIMVATPTIVSGLCARSYTIFVVATMCNGMYVFCEVRAFGSGTLL